MNINEDLDLSILGEERQEGYKKVKGPILKWTLLGKKKQKMWKYVFENNKTKEREPIYLSKRIKKKTMKNMETTTLPLYLIMFAY